MLGADLVSFNHFDYVRHFLNSCTRILGLESFPSRIEHHGRLVSLSICPAGIQPEDYEVTPDVQVSSSSSSSSSSRSSVLWQVEVDMIIDRCSCVLLLFIETETY